jgi:hypothetical protein
LAEGLDGQTLALKTVGLIFNPTHLCLHLVFLAHLILSASTVIKILACHASDKLAKNSTYLLFVLVSTVVTITIKSCAHEGEKKHHKRRSAASTS